MIHHNYNRNHNHNDNRNNNNDHDDKKSKLYVMICEIHHPIIHGQDYLSSNTSHYIVLEKFHPKSFVAYSCMEEDEDIYQTDSETNSDTDSNSNTDDTYSGISICSEVMYLYDTIQYYQNMYTNNELFINKIKNTPHPTIRNYFNIISNINYIKPEIGECIELPNGEIVAILKTCWLKIFQKKWRKWNSSIEKYMLKLLQQIQNPIRYKSY